MEVWISHSSLKESQSVTIHLDYVDKAIEEAERRFSFDELSLSAKFNGRTLCRDSSVPETTSQKPLELFEGTLKCDVCILTVNYTFNIIKH